MQENSRDEGTPIPSQGNASPWHTSVTAPCTRFDTPAGPLFLQDHCPASFIGRLRAESGLHAFTRRPESEHQLLLTIAKQCASKLTLAFTPALEIVGQVSLVPADGWWQDLQQVFEIGIEVSSSWRRLGIARQLMVRALSDEAVEDVIILGQGLSWHWDVEHLSLQPFQYRAFLARTASAYGFHEYLTSEPNVNDDLANILLARIGKHVTQQSINQFAFRLLQSDSLPGFSTAKS